MNLAVVLVSDQTIPNVVYLKNLLNYGEGFDKILLVTTQKMEEKGKSDAILKAVGEEFLYNKKHKKIFVDQNMLFDVKEKLAGYFNGTNFDKVFVNLTGGTKIMALGAYMFFERMNNAYMVYLPIGKTAYKQIKPLGKDGKAVDVPIEYRMDVDAYLDALGVEHEYSKPTNLELAKYIFDRYMENDDIFKELTKILRWYREGKDKNGNKKDPKKIKKSEDYSKIKELLEKVDINADNYDFRRRTWIDFFSGGWFEEYVYSIIKDLCVYDTKINVKRKTIADNEFDVVFIKDNSLYVIECKTGDMKSNEITNSLYKAAELNKELGLGAKTYFVTLSKVVLEEKIKNKLNGRSELVGVNIIYRDNIEEKGLREIFGKFKCK